MISKNSSQRVPRSPFLLVALASLSWTIAPAQTNPDPGATQESTVSTETLLKRINDLEAAQKQLQEKIDKLTAAQESAAVPASAPAAAAAAQPEQTAESAQSDSSGIPETGHMLGPVKLQGFSDFDFGKPWFDVLPNGGLAGSTRSFTVGDFDLFTNTRISEHFSLLGELLITSDFTNEFSAEMDRLLLTYRQNDYFSISIGKFNTALGYYSNAFNRAEYFQTAVGRPVMYTDEDDGGLLPVHNIGITSTGKIPSGAIGLHWVAELANGRSANVEPIQNFVDENNGKAFNLEVYARPDWLPGLQAGISTYHDTMHPAGLDALRQNILTAHLVYVIGRLEWLNEGSEVRDTQLGSSRVFRSTATYSQVGWAFGRTRPFVRYDYQNVPGSDPVFGELGRRNGPSAGVSRRISDYVVLKVQYGRLSERAQPPANAVTGQLAVAF